LQNAYTPNIPKTSLKTRPAENDLEDDDLEQEELELDLNVEQLLQAERWSDYEEEESAPRPVKTAVKATSKPQKAKASGAQVVGQTEEGYTGPLASFYADELIVGTPQLVKSGKEATVYCCQSHPRMKASTGYDWLAAKVYRARENRSFKNYSVYQQGRTTMNTRLDKAIAQKSAKGLSAQFGMWIGSEYETLSRLHAAGADVPRPYAQAESAILFDYYGEPGHAAPQLFSVRLTDAEVPVLFEQIKRNMAILMEADRVHGDLSPYNILYWQGALKLIDFPQAVDPMDNPDAYALFVRDIANVCEYFALYDLVCDPQKLAFSLWMQSGRPRPKG
jgi:RIO kinase 1